MSELDALPINVGMPSAFRTKWLKNVPNEHCEVLDFWNRIKPRDGLPKRRDFDPTDLLPWLGNLHLVEICGDDARYLVYGSNIAQIHRREWTGKWISELNETAKDQLLAYYQDVRDARRPLFHIVPASIATKYHTWSRLFVPFADAQGEVRHILVHNVLFSSKDMKRQLKVLK
jgi:hypothetical protein